ncbi:MAG TPA: hypothetical protein VMT34_17710, partial [Aggregatilineales bacterium]|nr:hypothetical protein [Aggregatilineales bacterium]
MDLNTARDLVTFALTQFMANIVGPLILVLLLLFIGSRLLRLAVRITTTLARQQHIRPALVELMGATINVVGWVLIVVGALQVLHLDTMALAIGGSLSLAALGVASAASGNLGDIIAGLFLAFDPDFGTGFTIHSGDIIGTIEHIDLR